MTNTLPQLTDEQTWISYGANMVLAYGEEPPHLHRAFARQGIPCHLTRCDLCDERVMWAIRDDRVHCSYCGHDSPRSPRYIEWNVEVMTPVQIPITYKDFYFDTKTIEAVRVKVFDAIEKEILNEGEQG